MHLKYQNILSLFKISFKSGNLIKIAKDKKMKKTLFFLFILVTFMSCNKEEDDTDIVCTSDCTTINGWALTSGKKPLEGVNFQVKYVESGYFYYHSWIKRETKTTTDGFYSMDFHVNDNEVESFKGTSSSYFELKIDLNNLDPNKYILPDQVSGKGDTSYFVESIISLKRDTTYNVSLYIPSKEYITVALNNFNPTQDNDCFEVQTFFPWGIKSSENKDEKQLLNTEYGVSFSGYDKFVAKTENQVFRNIPVARNDTNNVRIIKVKNGIASSEDHKIFVPENNIIKLIYEY